MEPNFSEFRAWLKSPEHAAQMAKLLADAPKPPRQDWPVDTAELVTRHRELGTMQLHWAVQNFKAADLLEAA